MYRFLLLACLLAVGAVTALVLLGAREEARLPLPESEMEGASRTVPVAPPRLRGSRSTVTAAKRRTQIADRARRPSAERRRVPTPVPGERAVRVVGTDGRALAGAQVSFCRRRPWRRYRAGHTSLKRVFTDLAGLCSGPEGADCLVVSAKGYLPVEHALVRTGLCPPEELVRLTRRTPAKRGISGEPRSP